MKSRLSVSTLARLDPAFQAGRGLGTRLIALMSFCNMETTDISKAPACRHKLVVEVTAHLADSTRARRRSISNDEHQLSLM